MTETTTSSLLQEISASVQGFGLGLLLVFLSQLNVTLGGLNFGLSFLPAAALLFWPKKASVTWSMIFVFLLGLFQDIVSFGPPGLWAFCYLAAYLALRVELRNADSFRRSFAGYVVYLIVLVLLLLLLGRLVLDTWPSWLPLLNDAVASLLVFPLIFWLRSFFVTARKEPRERKAA